MPKFKWKILNMLRITNQFWQRPGGTGSWSISTCSLLITPKSEACVLRSGSVSIVRLIRLSRNIRRVLLMDSAVWDWFSLFWWFKTPCSGKHTSSLSSLRKRLDQLVQPRVVNEFIIKTPSDTPRATPKRHLLSYATINLDYIYNLRPIIFHGNKMRWQKN